MSTTSNVTEVGYVRLEETPAGLFLYNEARPGAGVRITSKEEAEAVIESLGRMISVFYKESND